MKINNNFNVLPFYDSLQKQNSKKWYTFGQHYPLICPNKSLLPFQFVVDTNITLYNIEAVEVCSGNVTDLGVKPECFAGSQSGASYYIVKMNATTINEMSEGLYYLKIQTSEGYIYSEEFIFVDNATECIKLEYWNEDNLNFNGGEINFENGFRFNMYIQSTIGKPEYEFEEELTKRLGYKFIESQTSNKIYKFNFLAPEYICDAMRLVRLCDYIKLSTKYDGYNALTLSYEPKWKDNGDLASVEVEFETDCIIQKLESFNRRLKDSFYNALLANENEPILLDTQTVAQYYTEFTATAYMNGRLIRQLEHITDDEIQPNMDNLVLPIDNQLDEAKTAKKISLSDIYKYISNAGELFKGHYDETGNLLWIEALANLGVNGGITSFINNGTIDLPTLYEGLPIDNQTLYWEVDENGKKVVLKAKGGEGTGGGSVQYSLSWDGFSKGSWDGSEAKTILIPSKLSDLTNDGFFKDYGWTGEDANEQHFGSYLFGDVANSNTPIDSGQLIAFNSNEGEYRGYQMFMHGQNYFFRQHWDNEWKQWRKVISGNVEGVIDYDLTIDSKLFVYNNINLRGQEGGDMKFVFNPNGSITNIQNGGDIAIRHALRFQWYGDSYEIGAIRGGGTEARGFGVTYGNHTLIFEVGVGFCDFHTPVNIRKGLFVQGNVEFADYVNFVKPTKFTGNAGQNDISFVYNEDGVITNKTHDAESIRHALRFQWFKDAYEIGAVRTSWDEAFGFGVTYNNSQLVWKVNKERMDVYGDLRIKNGLIRYNETEGYFYIDGNVVVSGGVTAFADEGSGSQWIMDVETLEEVVSDNPFKVYSAKVVSMIASKIAETQDMGNGVTTALDKLAIIEDGLSSLTSNSTTTQVRTALTTIYLNLSNYVRDTE